MARPSATGGRALRALPARRQPIAVSRREFAARVAREAAGGVSFGASLLRQCPGLLKKRISPAQIGCQPGILNRLAALAGWPALVHVGMPVSRWVHKRNAPGLPRPCSTDKQRIVPSALTQGRRS